MDQHSREEHSIGRAFDILCVAAALTGARELVSHLSARGLFIYPPDWASQFWRLGLIAFAGWIAASAYTHLYRTSLLEETIFEVRSLLRTLLLYALICIGALFVVKLQNVSRQFMAYTLLLTAAGISVRHFGATIYYTRLKRFGYDWRTALVIGNRAQCKRFNDLFERIGPIGYRLVLSPLDGKSASQALSSDYELSDIDDAFLLPGGVRQDHLILRLLKEGKSVHIVPELFDARLFRRTFGDLGGAPVVSIWTGRLTLLQAILKRAADIAGALLLLFVLSPLFLIIAVLIKLTSKGPIWFSQARLGRLGKTFYIYKFRTMVANAETILRNAPGLYEKYVANNYKLPSTEDPRITRLGALLRASSLDELPQLLNVLKGEMSLVGPRPIVTAEVEKYNDYAALFLSAKPGMTGHWQVCGRSDIEDYNRRVELDLEYLRDQSLSKDVEILLRTVPSVLLRKGAH